MVKILSSFCGSESTLLKNQLITVQISFLFVVSFLQVTHTAKILFYVGFSSHSHRVALQPLATKLSERGHDVTFLSPIKPEVENPKIKEFCPKGLLDYNNRLEKSMTNEQVTSRLNDKYSDSFFDNFGTEVWDMNYQCNEATLHSPDLQEWMENSKFDLVVTEHPYKEVALAIAYKYGAKVIGFSSSPVVPSELDMHGIPTEASWLPDINLGNGYGRYIPERFSYEINYIMWNLYYRWSYLPKINSLIQNVFKNEPVPSIENLIKNISILLHNTHFSNEYGRSVPPFVVPVGGMHAVETKKPLTKNVEDFITSGTEGFIFISFGSFVRVSGLPETARKHFFDAIRSFQNARFLIKWNDEIPEDMPNNVLPMKWLPQQDILAHPQCRGFVSQGGLMSFQQAAYHGVPVLIIPVFCDQPYNARIAVMQGNGIYLELADLTFETFSSAIRQLLHNDTLLTRAKEVSRRFKDRPMTPVDTAVWWTEYVLRHNGTSHLKPLGIHQQWWQRRLLDFWAIVFTLVFLISFTTIWAICRLIRLFIKFSTKQPHTKIKRT